MTKNPFKYFLLPAVFFCLASKAQFYNLPNEYSSSLITEKILNAKDSSIHCGVKPYIHFFSPKYANVNDTFRIFKYIVDDPALDVVFYKHTINIQPHNQNYKFTIDPVLNVDLGTSYYNGKRRSTVTNGRGFIAAGYIGDKVYFESLFSENQSVLPMYVDTFVKAAQVVPGQGRTKPFKATGYDYAFSSGFVSLQPYKTLNIQVGHGKHKIGNGYRSLLLSDNSFNYPYIRITQQLLKGRLQYTNIYAVLMNLDPATKIINPNVERLFQKKAASFQYLSANPFKFLNIGLFQGMIWRAGDDRNKQHLDINYFDPLIFVNAAKYGLNNPNNILIGGDIKIKITNKINVYGQYMADNLSNALTIGNGWGWQAGVNFYDLFKVKNLFFQVEYNSVTEGSYISPVTASTDQSWSHYNQSLAYTPGYGNELIVITNYKFRRLFLDLKYYHIDVPSAKDYFYTRQMVNGRIGFLINPSNNLTVHLGYVYRNQNFPNFKSYDNESTYIYLGVRTNISNFYYDF